MCLSIINPGHGQPRWACSLCSTRSTCSILSTSAECTRPPWQKESLPAAPAGSVPESASEPNSCATALRLPESILRVCRVLFDSAETTWHCFGLCRSSTNRGDYWGVDFYWTNLSSSSPFLALPLWRSKCKLVLMVVLVMWCVLFSLFICLLSVGTSLGETYWRTGLWEVLAMSSLNVTPFTVHRVLNI